MFRVLIICFAFGSATFGAHVENSSNVLVITNATIIDGTGAAPRPRMSLIIDDRRITKIESSETADIPKHAQSIDATGKYVIPGLWDMHIHLFATGECALPALVGNGVTGIRDMGGLLRDLDLWRIRIDTGVIVGPRIIRSGPMLNGRQFGIHQIAVVNESEARGAVRALHKAGVDCIKVHRAISREAYFGAVNESRNLGIPLVGHIPNTVTPREASDAGQACIEHVGTLFDGTFSAEHRDEPFAAALDQFIEDSAGDLFARFASNRTAFTPTLVSHRMITQFGRAKPDERDKYVSSSARKLTADILARDGNALTPEFYERTEQIFNAALRVVKPMQKAGVRLLAGTDVGGAKTYPGFDLHEELALMVDAGLTPMEALQSATCNPAEFLQLSDSGVIAVGKRADLVLLDANPLEDIRNTQKINAVILHGKSFDRNALNQLLLEAERTAQKTE